MNMLREIQQYEIASGMWIAWFPGVWNFQNFSLASLLVLIFLFIVIWIYILVPPFLGISTQFKHFFPISFFNHEIIPVLLGIEVKGISLKIKDTRITWLLSHNISAISPSSITYFLLVSNPLYISNFKDKLIKQ